MAKRLTHVHKYKKVLLGNPDKKYKVLRCMKGGCTHYIGVALAEGLLCECNRCHEPFVMTKHSCSLTKPHCEACTKRAKTETINVNKLEELFK